MSKIKKMEDLNFNEIRQYFCELATDKECMKFQQLCITYSLNPWVNDAYLVKYKPKYGKPQQPAKTIVGKDVYLKRAMQCKDYAGHEVGIIIQRETDIIEIQGTFMLESDKLLGGWSKVYKHNHQCPTYFSVKLSDFVGINLWKTMPGIMIRKVALVSAFREAFPETFAGLYIAEEMGIDTPVDKKETKHKAETNSLKQDQNEKEKDLSPVNLNAEQEQPKKITKGNFEFFESMKRANDMIGENAYYDILGKYGYEHANQCSMQDSDRILNMMRDYYNDTTKGQ